MADVLDVDHDLSGVAVEWQGADNSHWSGWLPHADFVAAREFTRASAPHDSLWRHTTARGTLTLRAQLDLWQMLQPATQPGSRLDYVPEPETVTVSFRSDAALRLEASGAKVDQTSEREVRLTVAGPRENRWSSIVLSVTTPVAALDVSWHTSRDARPRALGTKRFLMPFAQPGARDLAPRPIPEIAGADWQAGRALFNGKAACATCHELRGEGKRVGPELGNLVHRDYASVLLDLAEPNATINPDGVGYVVTTKSGESFVGTQLGESAYELQLAQVGGAVAKIKKSDIAKTEPMTVSLMPPGLEKSLTPMELRDLMAYLLTIPAAVPPR